MNTKLNVRTLWQGQCPLLGPAVYLWVQGCPMRCPGCFNTDGLPMEQELSRVEPEQLAEICVCNGNALVLSGGEPFAQAPALAALCQHVRKRAPEINILSYTGYTLKTLLGGNIDGAPDLLRQLDVLVDGPFQKKRLSNHPLLGSDNQRVFLLSRRVSPEQLRALDRPQLQYSLSRDGHLHLVGTGGQGLDMHQLTRLIERRGVVLK